MINKIFGYLLILIGLVLIFWTLFGSYNIFTGTSSAPEIFPIYADNTPASNSQDLQKQIEDAIKKQIGDLIPADSIPKILNLISWSILAGILILGGGKISSIGIKLISIKTDVQP